MQCHVISNRESTWNLMRILFPMVNNIMPRGKWINEQEIKRKRERKRWMNKQNKIKQNKIIIVNQYISQSKLIEIYKYPQSDKRLNLEKKVFVCNIYFRPYYDLKYPKIRVRNALHTRWSKTWKFLPPRIGKNWDKIWNSFLQEVNFGCSFILPAKIFDTVIFRSILLNLFTDLYESQPLFLSIHLFIFFLKSTTVLMYSEHSFRSKCFPNGTNNWTNETFS